MRIKQLLATSAAALLLTGSQGADRVLTVGAAMLTR